MNERILDPPGSLRSIGGSTPKRRGRPPGSVSLTAEIRAKIIGLVRGGVMLHVAATAAGVSPRTVGEWIARGEARHPTRPPTAKLRRFAREVRVAGALARIDAETRVYRENPKMWLRNAARTTGGKDGWTVPSPKERARSVGEHFMDILDKLDRSENLDRQDQAKRRRGRPVGSVSLTKEIQHTIVTFIRAGAFVHAAAEAAGVSRSAFFEWMARGEDRHRTQGTPKLRRFAREVRRAQAEARAAAEVRVHQQHPSHWLRHAAGTDGEAEGWGEPRTRKEEESDGRLSEILLALDEVDSQRSEPDPHLPPPST